MLAIKGTFSRRLLRRLWNQHGYTYVSDIQLDALEEALLEHIETLFTELKRAGGLSLGLTYWRNRLKYTVTLPWDSQTGWQLRFGTEKQKTHIIKLAKQQILDNIKKREKKS